MTKNDRWQKRAALAVTLAVLFLAGCSDDGGESGGGGTGGGGGPPPAKTGKVTFFNESSYTVVVHHSAFSGAVLLELSAGNSKAVDVRANEKPLEETVFSVEYRYHITDGFDADSGEIFASGLDPNVQHSKRVEADSVYTIQIPQPQALEFQTAFVKILNAANLQCTFRHLSEEFIQTGNKQLSIQTGKTGVYEIKDIPGAGKLLQSYTVVSNFQSAPVPECTVQKGMIYTFSYDGSTVTQTGDQQITFR